MTVFTWEFWRFGSSICNIWKEPKRNIKSVKSKGCNSNNHNSLSVCVCVCCCALMHTNTARLHPAWRTAKNRWMTSESRSCWFSSSVGLCWRDEPHSFKIYSLIWWFHDCGGERRRTRGDCEGHRTYHPHHFHSDDSVSPQAFSNQFVISLHRNSRKQQQKGSFCMMNKRLRASRQPKKTKHLDDMKKLSSNSENCRNTTEWREIMK